MKPIEKYQQKFVELLKEMEEELGGNLVVEVRSGEEIVEGYEGMTNYPITKKQYNFSVKTNNGFSLF